MRCPYCFQDNDKVVDSRTIKDASEIRRRRQCLSCGRRFTSYERITESVLKVVKKDDSRVSFDREKLRVGLEKACWKLPIPSSKLEEIASQIESKVMKEHEQEVDSRELGELCMEALKILHHVAYVRFASVYREFKDVTGYVDVLDELARMRDRKK